MKAFLDGQQLEEDSGAGWTLEPGAAPHVRVMEVDEGLANFLFANSTREGSVLRLEAIDEGLGFREISRLSIIGTGPSALRGTSTITVVDRRFWWKYNAFKRSYNVRRRTGNRRRIPGAPVDNVGILDDEAYAVWSLKDGTEAWTGEDAIRDVLDEVAGAGQWRVEGSPFDRIPEEIEGVELAATADIALGQILAYFGLALQVYVDYDGTVVLYDRLDRGEFDVVGAGGGATSTGTRPRNAVPGIGQPFVRTPLWSVQDRRKERPSKVIVHFTRAMELRLDYEEDATGAAQDGLGGTGIRGEQQPAPPRIENVVPLPEDATIDGKNLVLGTWVPLDQYLAFLEGKEPKGLPPLTVPILRKGYISPVVQAYASPRGDSSGLWAARASAVHGSYRLRFKVQKTWLQRIRSIRPYRVAIADVERDARGPATVFADHAKWITWRWLEAKKQDVLDELHQTVQNVFSNPAAANGGQIIGTPIEDLQAAPAIVNVVDEDQGILEIQFIVDSTRQVQTLIPSALDKDSIPYDDPTRDNQWLAYANLTPTHEVSIVLTVAPAAPNDLRVFHPEEITPQDVGSEAGEGPPMNVIVSPSRVIARHGWDDARADALFQAFTPGGNQNLTEVLGDPLNNDEVQAYAKSVAASVYARFANHVEGGLTTAFNPSTPLRGTISAVSHEFSGQSGGVTILTLPEDPPPLDQEALLPAGIRRLVNRLVDP